MLTRRTFATRFGATLLGATALGGVIPSRFAFAQGAPASPARGNYLIKNGAVITVDAALGTLPRADVLVRNGRIERSAPTWPRPAPR